MNTKNVSVKLSDVIPYLAEGGSATIHVSTGDLSKPNSIITLFVNRNKTQISSSLGDHSFSDDATHVISLKNNSTIKENQTGIILRDKKWGSYILPDSTKFPPFSTK